METRPTLFSERQKFTQVWVWIFLIGTVGFIGYIDYKQLVEGVPVGTKPAPDVVLILISLLMIGLLFFFLSLQLVTEIREEGIYYKFSPIQMRFHHIPWSEIQKVEVREYRPIGDFLGWGIRWSPTGKGRAYTVKGDQGIQLVLKDGKQVLIGTGKPEAVRQVLREVRA